jgi:hypothetical protein
LSTAYRKHAQVEHIARSGSAIERGRVIILKNIAFRGAIGLLAVETSDAEGPPEELRVAVPGGEACTGSDC